MLGLDFAPASSAEADLNLARVVGRRVTQTEQNREYSASPFYYGNGGTKFRKSEILCSARWAASLIVQDHLCRRFARFKLCAHFLKCRSESFDLFLLLPVSRFKLGNDCFGLLL